MKKKKMVRLKIRAFVIYICTVRLILRYQIVLSGFYHRHQKNNNILYTEMFLEYYDIYVLNSSV